MSTKDEILASHMSEFEKYLTLNYKACFGTEEAVKNYYEKGIVSADNFKGIGRCHLVKVEDLVNFCESNGDTERMQLFKEQYITGEEANRKHFWDFFKLKIGYDQYNTKKFKRKLWVVELLNEKEPTPKTPVLVHLLNFFLYPLKFIPRKDVLRMPNYTLYTFRVGDVRNGFSVEFQIPKKFSFK